MSNKNPQCLGFIMDGNRRWAREQGKESIEGHTQGREVLQTCVEWVVEKNIPHVVFYAFSTENWQRSEAEVSYLMQLFASELQTITKKEVNLQIVGRRTDFSADLIQAIEQAEAANSQDHTTTVWIAVSSGGRAELVAAVNQAVQRGELVTEESFETLLWTGAMPDPDMIVRTGGEQRLSNFLTWKSTYSELHFIAKHWPALTRADFDDILVEYECRHRRRGK